MPDKYTLRYLPAADADLVEILDFIARDSPNRALSYLEKLDKRIGLLEHHPLLGRMPRHPKLREFGYRVLIVEAYLVFYVVRGRTIEIHRVVHGSRNLDQLIWRAE
ncbi:MAG: type II toxin-antitoxin system RelE/ParE family toxin [Ignavibacteriae bacterium]|nr:type II toxin-antitoxin system RelE/ParE family toxin [Ignavibacteriota bacterium]